MNLRNFNPERAISAVLAVYKTGRDEFLASLGALPAPVYVTDAQGFVTYFNPPCIDFTGRVPALGKDRWCVTWKLHTETGEPLPHDQCPMAQAIKTAQAIRGVSAVAERPDGTKVIFIPYPTPLFGDDGQLCGAVNILIDITDLRQASLLREQAAKCRRLAQGVGDRQTVEVLTRLADDYEEQAKRLDRQN